MDDSNNALCAINYLWTSNISQFSDSTYNSTAQEAAEEPYLTPLSSPLGATSPKTGLFGGNDDCWNGSFVDVVLVPTVCALGILGNLLTLIVLSRRRLAVICDGSERTVHVGLRALAVSDLLVCLCQLPQGFIYRGCFVYSERTFQLVYWTYSGALINTFLMSSAWLVVTMAIGRYITTAYPFKFRAVIGITSAKVTAAAVFVASFLLNLPRLFEYRIETIVCRTVRDDVSETSAGPRIVKTITATALLSNNTADDDVETNNPEDDVFEIYMQVPGWLQTIDRRAELAYLWIYFGFGVCIPLTLLAIGNCGLVVAVRRSSRVRRRYRVGRTHVDANDRVTSVLISVVIAYLLLVTPAEILMFVERQLLEEKRLASINSLVAALNVANLLQTINFSFNFMLYIALNLQFRRTMRDLICCWTRRHTTAAAVAGATLTSFSPHGNCCLGCCSPSPPVIARRVNFNRDLTLKAYRNTSGLR